MGRVTHGRQGERGLPLRPQDDYSGVAPLNRRNSDRRSIIPPTPPPKRHPYDQWSPDARALDLVGDKWTLLIIRDLAAGPRRFVELQRVLPGISTEQLRSRLNRMVADGLLTRQRFREVPPRVEYSLTDRARELAPVIGALARWGYDWAWSAPREGEAIDVGAVFRASVGLLESAPPAGGGTVEMRVDDHAYSMTVEGDRVELREEPAADAKATVRGSQSAWLAALGPDADRSDLEVSGDSRLADALLDGVGAQARRAVNAA
jgi:DNA-binding HxlR family transcriptional regulator